MQVGGAIPLSIQLFDCDTNQFVRAWVRKPDGSIVGTDPVDLTQVALGLYQDFSLDFPNVPFVTVQYIVYEDAGYTVISTTEGSTSDTIFRDPPSSGGGGGSTAFTTYLTGVIDGEVPCAPNGIQDVVVKGSQRTLTIQLQRAESQQPLDLTDEVTITCRFLNADRTVLSVSSDDLSGPITVTNAGGGTFTCELTAEQTDLLMEQTPAPFTVIVELSDGDVVCNLPFQLSVVDKSV